MSDQLSLNNQKYKNQVLLIDNRILRDYDSKKLKQYVHSLLKKILGNGVELKSLFSGPTSLHP